MDDNGIKYLNASDFAAIGGYVHHSVLRWLRKGLVPGAKKIEAGNTFVYLIPEDVIHSFQPPRRGRPRKTTKAK